MFRDSIIAAIRTGVAALAGLIVTWLISQGIDLPEDFAANFTAVVFILATSAYNLIVGFLERKVNPLFGIMLGIPKAPAYGSVGTKTPGTKDAHEVDKALIAAQPGPPPVPPVAPGEGGLASLLLVGIVIAIAGLVIWLATTADLIGIIVLIAGAVIAVFSAASDRRSAGV